VLLAACGLYLQIALSVAPALVLASGLIAPRMTSRCHLANASGLAGIGTIHSSGPSEEARRLSDRSTSPRTRRP
jgi:hypothetical protein